MASLRRSAFSCGRGGPRAPQDVGGADQKVEPQGRLDRGRRGGEKRGHVRSWTGTQREDFEAAATAQTVSRHQSATVGAVSTALRRRWRTGAARTAARTSTIRAGSIRTGSVRSERKDCRDSGRVTVPVRDSKRGKAGSCFVTDIMCREDGGQGFVQRRGGGSTMQSLEDEIFFMCISECCFERVQRY